MEWTSPLRDKAWRRWLLHLNCCGFFIAAIIPICPATKLRPLVSGYSKPRPDYIARLHGAAYDLRTCEALNRPEMLRRYQQALADAAKLAGYSEAMLQAAVASDYSVWVKQERLPRIDRR